MSPVILLDVFPSNYTCRSWERSYLLYSVSMSRNDLLYMIPDCSVGSISSVLSFHSLSILHPTVFAAVSDPDPKSRTLPVLLQS